MINFINKIRSTWLRINELEKKVHDMEKYLVDEKSKKEHTPPVVFSPDEGTPWFTIRDEDIERRR